MDRHERNAQRSANPQAGDMWHDMFAPVCVILEVRNNWLTVCRKTKCVDRDHWSWDVEKAEDIRADEFFTSLRYKFDGLRDKFWCDCYENRDKYTVAWWQENKEMCGQDDRWLLGLA